MAATATATKTDQKCIGVVIRDFPKSEDCLTAMEWVHNLGIILPPEGYKLCVILIETDAESTDAQAVSLKDDKRILSLDTWDEVELALNDKRRKADQAGEQAKATVDEFQRLAGGLKEGSEEDVKNFFKEHVKDVFGRMYKGPMSIQKSLELAIKELQPAGLSTLIVRYDDVHAASSSSSQNKLLPVESLKKKLPAGCSIVLVGNTTTDKPTKNNDKGKKPKGRN